MLIILYLFLMGISAGLIGAVIGIGGGIIIVPFLTLALKVPIYIAIGTSIISVLVTSLAASRLFLKKNITNIALGLTLEIPTAAGGIIGSVAVAYLKNKVLFIIFGCFTVSIGIFTYLKNTYLKNKNLQVNTVATKKTNINDLPKISKSSIFDSEYYDEASGKSYKYKVKNVIYGSIASLFAGLSSGLLGIGGGVIKVPAMNILMNIPIKVATATSNYMIGITAVVSAIIYFYNGYINLYITIPVAAGVLLRATAGSFTAGKLKSRYIVVIILIIFIAIGVLMFLRAFNIISF
ncbi:MAG: sulfite exporter TauE/SafE family protein [Actinobacteria bacterium]|nr:sulfite exporter TauE/SafE family protein [Actinomycetota bacterium]